jgi:RNA polymerase sigma-54 factor
MKAGLSQSTQLRQELKINPRLYQAMDLLYMPLLDLQQHLKQELLNNPFLDMVELEDEEGEEEDAAEPEAPPEQKDSSDEIDWEEILLDGSTPAAVAEHEERSTRAGHRRHARPLDHLADQITLLDLTPRQQLRRRIHREHQRGRLSRLSARHPAADGQRHDRQAAEAIEARHRGPAAVHAAGVDDMLHGAAARPAGSARDLRECLMLQLREAGSSNPFRSASCAVASTS